MGASTSHNSLYHHGLLIAIRNKSEREREREREKGKRNITFVVTVGRPTTLNPALISFVTEVWGSRPALLRALTN
jgi:hypothetical protein